MYILQKTRSNLVNFGLGSLISDLQTAIGGHHPVLYFTTQITEKYSTAMCYLITIMIMIIFVILIIIMMILISMTSEMIISQQVSIAECGFCYLVGVAHLDNKAPSSQI